MRPSAQASIPAATPAPPLKVAVVTETYAPEINGVALVVQRLIERLSHPGRPDVIYVATEGLLGRSAVNQARRAGIPVVTGFHTNFHAYSSHYGIWLVAPFAVLVALSRMVLGLHYPSDVLAGAVLGALLAEAGLAAAVLWAPLLP